MHLNNPWKKIYENWPVRDNREAMALKLLSEAKSERIMEETGMNREEYRAFNEMGKRVRSITFVCQRRRC